ncbi:MAG: TasA family protein [Candidatus Gribaldobacteria bacterium]|nr:TasA family protein [Candidatus Gribaldobacteria bacterium]
MNLTKRKLKMYKKAIERFERKESHKKNGFLFKKLGLKSLAIVLIIQLNFSGIFTAGNALAYFVDQEVGTSELKTETLDFSLVSDNWQLTASSTTLAPGDVVQKNITVINNGSLGFQYSVQALKTSGDSAFCDALILNATVDSNLIFNGKLIDFSGTTTFSTTANNIWNFQAGLPATSTIYFNKTCEFKFNFIGWQENLSSSSQGFWDQEENFNILSSLTGPKINKVYYNVDSKHGTEADNEWVEIFNPSAIDINLKNWEICDNNTCRVVNNDTIIPSLGFVVISNSSSTWNYWNIPTEVEKIQLNGTLYLDNVADMLLLKEPSGTIVDQMNWGTPNSIWSNFNTDIWDPGALDVGEGNLLSRVPNGLDTNQPSDFQKLALPQIAVSPIVGRNFCGQCNGTGPVLCAPLIVGTWPFDITWTATNPNGNDADLLIDLYYITDNDCSGTVSPGDQTFLISKGLNNTGSYNWPAVMPTFFGYVWFKVVAHGPENIMLNSSAVSNPGFEPTTDEMAKGCFPDEGPCNFSDENNLCPNKNFVTTSTQEVASTSDDILATTTSIIEEIAPIASEEEAEIIEPLQIEQPSSNLEQPDVAEIVQEQPAIEPEATSAPPSDESTSENL